jgi:SAM-dependent methyltransferase
MTIYSRYDWLYRSIVPSIAKSSYHPLVRIAADAVSTVLSLPFRELRDLPANHLRIRTGVGNRILTNHIDFATSSHRYWLTFLSRQFCTPKSDVVELGCGCGRLTRALKEPWFEGTYLGVDIDNEMLEYCRKAFTESRFKFLSSPHHSDTYSPNKPHNEDLVPIELVIAESDSKDFVYSLSLYSHLLEKEAEEYMRETYRILRHDGIMYLSFFCMEHAELGRRWTFQHRVGNSYVENLRYPEAAVAYHTKFMMELAKSCGFREVTINRWSVQSELVARK